MTVLEGHVDRVLFLYKYLMIVIAEGVPPFNVPPAFKFLLFRQSTIDLRPI